MRQFGIIGGSIWKSKRFRQLETDLSRLTYLYLHTTSYGNSAGAFVLPPEMTALDLKVSPDTVRGAYLELAQVNLIRYDPDEELLQIANFFRFNPISSRKHLAGPTRILDALPESPVRAIAVAELVANLVTRTSEWQSKVTRLQAQLQTESATSRMQKDAADIRDAIAGFLSSAIELIDKFQAHGAIKYLPEKDQRLVCETLLINPADIGIDTPTDTPIDIRTREKDTEKDKTITTDKTITKDKTITTETGQNLVESDIQAEIAALNAKR